MGNAVIIVPLGLLVVLAADEKLNDGRLARSAISVAEHVLRSFGWL